MIPQGYGFAAAVDWRSWFFGLGVQTSDGVGIWICVGPLLVSWSPRRKAVETA